MVDSSKRETLGFQTEVRQLLKLMIHSLYSNKEIFLRELISNASDATDKLRFESLANPDLLGGETDLSISIQVDTDKQQLSIIDNGIGMSRDELIDNLGTIARSGTAEFLEQMTGDKKHDAQLIGQFGVGFYSSFIVANKVTVETRRAGLAANEAVRWESDGEGEFAVENIDRAERGTRVTLSLKDDQKEFAEPLRVETLIRKYSDHIGFPVSLSVVGDDDKEPRIVNSATALWTRPRSDVKDDDYKEFYKYLTHDFVDPLAWSHNRVEGKREYTSLLFIPAAAPFDLWNRDAPRGLKLYVQRVFIMDDAEQFLPLYLRFVKGVVDSSDLPLNVSRELLQQNPDLVAMRGALTRRVLGMLEKMASSDSDDYRTVWREFGQVLKEGVIEDQANREKLAGLLRFASTHGDNDAQDQSLADYIGRAGPEQDKIYFILADNYSTAVASPHLEQLRKRGIEVLLLTDRIDPWLVDSLAEFDGRALVDVGRSTPDLPESVAEASEDEINEQHRSLLEKMKKTLGSRVDAVKVSRRLVDSPACVVAAENDISPQLRRMLEASGQAIPESRPILEINVEHPLVGRLSTEADEAVFDDLSNIVMDHALLAEGGQLDNPAKYVQRMNKLLLDLNSGGAGE
ncbi:MAG: molecular chaperone HtpG [Gammaproteobacteria bacterium]|nr:molecular chaperone HtpG [Gammaproteobacteria bacterium]MBT8110792.1 molecular chaperone HtpG [Gammaproteobacteria bacterium]NNL45491.1 molecular chaperone HtpG [Woeseiaceae bacterium]